MPQTFRTALILVPPALVVASAVLARQVPPADEPPGAAPEVVLAEKGLNRVGNCYVLRDQPERDSKLRELAAVAEINELRYKPLLDEKRRIENEIKVRRKASREAAREELRALELQYKFDFDRYHAERDRINDARNTLIAENRKAYEALWNDPPVKRAIRAYNREHRPKIVLGPVAGPAEYRAMILGDDAALLREKGMVLEKGRRWVVEGEARVCVLAFQVHNRLEQWLAVEAAVVAGTPSKLSEKRKAVAERLADAPEPQRRQLAAEVTLLDTQIRRLAPEAPGMAAAWRERAGHVAKARRAFLDAVADARRAADDAVTGRRQLEGDDEVLDTLAEIEGKMAPRLASGAIHIAEPLEYRRGLASLKEYEAAIRVERLPLERRADGPGFVAVVLNGSHGAGAALEPGAAMTRLPAPLALTIGASPGPGSPVVDVLLPDNQTARGRLAVIRTVAVGAVTVEHVPCLVMPDDGPGPAWPVLGADALDLLGGEISEDGTELVITRIVPPPRKAAAPAGRS